MKECWDTKQHRHSAIICIAAVCCLDVFTLIVFLTSNRSGLAFFIPFLFILIAMMLITYAAFANYIIYTRRYGVTEKGIVIAYPFGAPIFYPWEQISDVGICKVHYPRRGAFRYEVIIRCVIGKEEKGPKQGFGNWTTTEYEALHLWNIVTIRFSALRLSEFQKMYPFGVNDYRSIKRYYWDPE